MKEEEDFSEEALTRTEDEIETFRRIVYAKQKQQQERKKVYVKHAPRSFTREKSKKENILVRREEASEPSSQGVPKLGKDIRNKIRSLNSKCEFDNEMEAIEFSKVNMQQLIAETAMLMDDLEELQNQREFLISSLELAKEDEIRRIKELQEVLGIEKDIMMAAGIAEDYEHTFPKVPSMLHQEDSSVSDLSATSIPDLVLPILSPEFEAEWTDRLMQNRAVSMREDSIQTDTGEMLLPPPNAPVLAPNNPPVVPPECVIKRRLKRMIVKIIQEYPLPPDRIIQYHLAENPTAERRKSFLDLTVDSPRNPM